MKPSELLLAVMTGVNGEVRDISLVVYIVSQSKSHITPSPQSAVNSHQKGHHAVRSNHPSVTLSGQSLRHDAVSYISSFGRDRTLSRRFVNHWVCACRTGYNPPLPNRQPSTGERRDHQPDPVKMHSRYVGTRETSLSKTSRNISKSNREKNKPLLMLRLYYTLKIVKGYLCLSFFSGVRESSYMTSDYVVVICLGCWRHRQHYQTG